MISYAQNREDVLLNRVFRDSTGGFYVDVGAAHPQLDSVTYWFYTQGWRGINIEPRANMFRLLCAQRPHDINLNIGVSNQRGSLRFFEVEEPTSEQQDVGGLSTLDAQAAEQHRRMGKRVRESTIAVHTLTEVLEQNHAKEISFLKIDAEGHERHVIEGWDWTRFRPRVILAEATLPQTNIPCHGDWEPLILAANYLFATSDGINRYYVRAEDRALLERFETPVNVLDDYVPHQLLELHNTVVRLRRDLRRARRFSFGYKAVRLINRASNWFGPRRAA